MRHALFLCGDVMTGRGVDQILPHPSSPELYEPYLRDARRYVALAEEVNGPIQRPVSFEYVWGDALRELHTRAPDVRIVNLETSVTTSDAAWPDKGINYRMHPGNVPCLAAADVDVCVLANNHVMDWGRPGLVDTIGHLHAAGMQTAGAGRDDREAEEVALVELSDDRRVLVVAVADASSGVPLDWGAHPGVPGVAMLREDDDDAARAIGDRIARVRRPGDCAVVSIHWGSNWGYDVPDEHVRFAHQLVEHGVDVVHGHSSHHPRPIEIHRGKPILYGCGDLLTDYEGIGGHEAFRSELGPMYFVVLDDGDLRELRLVLMRTRKMRLERASPADVVWTRTTLATVSRPFGTAIDLDRDGSLLVRQAVSSSARAPR